MLMFFVALSAISLLVVVYDHFNPSIELKLFLLEQEHKHLIKLVEKHKWVFADNEKVVEFSQLLTDRLLSRYKENGRLSAMEMKILDKAISDGIHSVSFFLLSQLEDDENKKMLIEKMETLGFKCMDDVGYVSTEPIRYVEI